MAAADQLAGLMSLISGINGTTQTTQSTGGTSTTQKNLSDAAVSEQIKQILAGSGGVQNIGNSARRTGLYNSTSEELLLGNLYATAANQAEIARAPTVTTTSPSSSATTTEGAGLGNTAALIAGAAGLNAVLNSDVAKGLGNSALNALGLGSSGAGPTTSAGSASVDYGLSGLLSGNPGFGITGSVDDGNGAAGGWSGDTFSTQMSLGLPGIDGGSVGASGNITKGSQDFDLLGSIGNAVSGFFTGGGLGGLVGAVQGGIGGGGSSGGTSGGSIICTALIHHNLLDAEHYALGEEYITKVPLEVKVGYYSWAAPIAKKILEGDKFWTRVCLPFARSRTALLATKGSFLDHIKQPLGSLTKFVGEPVCGIIGKRILKAPKVVNVT